MLFSHQCCQSRSWSPLIHFPMLPSFSTRRTCLLFLAALLFSFILLYFTSTWRRRPSSPLPRIQNLGDDDARLDRVLEAAAMDDKTVILTTLNAAWASPGSVLDLFLESFRAGNGTRELLKHLVIVALDRKAYVRCVAVHVHCFGLVTEGVDFSGAKEFLSDGYLLMMWRRIDFLRVVLEKGYNFIFSDVDIMWFRNPLLQFFPDGDFQIACDHYFGNSRDLKNRPNGGFNFVKSTNQSIKFYKFWYSSRENYPGYHDQDVFNFIKHDPYIKEIGLKIRFLSTNYFGGICEPSTDFSKVCTMHANCCADLRKKIHYLKVMLEDWRRYLSHLGTTEADKLSWRLPRNCRGKSYLGFFIKAMVGSMIGVVCYLLFASWKRMELCLKQKLCPDR